MTRFIDYAPMVFQPSPELPRCPVSRFAPCALAQRRIRASFGIHSDDYLRSVGPEQLLGNMALGLRFHQPKSSRGCKSATLVDTASLPTRCWATCLPCPSCRPRARAMSSECRLTSTRCVTIALRALARLLLFQVPCAGGAFFYYTSDGRLGSHSSEYLLKLLKGGDGKGSGRLEKGSGSVGKGREGSGRVGKGREGSGRARFPELAQESSGRTCLARQLRKYMMKTVTHKANRAVSQSLEMRIA